MKARDTGLNFQAIREELDAEPWELDSHEGRESRRVYLGTVFNLTPSGKVYVPWACSNVDGDCPVCGGSGTGMLKARRRVVKRAQVRARSLSRSVLRRPGMACDLATPRGAYAARVAKYRDKAYHVADQHCHHCDGTGSRSAYLDERWNEAVEEGLESIGACLESGEGDPCDLYASEYRDAEIDDDCDDEICATP